MKYRSQIVLSILLVAVLTLLPLRAFAIDASDADMPIETPVIITEVQTGGVMASDEFIELYNTSNEAVDITGWELRLAASGSTTNATTLLVTIVGNPEPVVLPGKSYFVLHTSSVVLPEGIMGQEYQAGLSKNDKTIALFARDETTCQMNVHDAVAWEAAVGTSWGEGSAVVVPASVVNADKILQRYLDVDGNYVDTNSNAHDFLLVHGTPGQHNPTSPIDVADEGDLSLLPSFAAPSCEPPSEEPTEELLSPVISELLPNPGPPQSDAADEYIELYNPNNVPFDLSGYTLQAGMTTTYQYTFPQSTTLEPDSYTTFFSRDTNIALSNSSGQVRLKDANGVVVYETASYTTAGNDQAWALINDFWQWSTVPTPNAVNEPTPEEPPTEEPPTEEPPTEEPPAETPPVPNVGLHAAQISELLPNPGAPKTDQHDEFIELYNPNEVVFDLSAYVLEAGLTSKYRYTFPAGTLLQPHSYIAFFSADTGVTLSNSSGQVRLIDPSGSIVAESGEYGTAKDDQAWTFIDGSWQWTNSPTPNATNVLTAPAPKTKAASSTAKSKKATASKSSTAKTKDTKSDKEDEGVVAGITDSNGPFHPGVLALIAGFAVLYGAYEYRHDLANKIRHFRTNRTTRRALGQGAKGR